MSFPNCPDCKNPSEPKQTKPNNEKNPSRWYFVCSHCPGKDGKPGKFLSWGDGKGNQNQNPPSSQNKRKRTLEEEMNYERQKSGYPPINPTEEKLDRVVDDLESLKKKIDQIHFILKSHCPLKRANESVPNLYSMELQSKEGENEFE